MLVPVPESSSDYRAALAQAMTELASDPRVVFLGQGVRDPGTFMSTTLTHLPIDKRIEMPVAEEMQLGMSIGMALTGLVPVSIFPRWNFLILAANQLVNHLDKMQSKVIVRVGVGSSKPFDPGPQHTSDFTDAFQLMMPNTYIRRLNNASDVIAEYRQALGRNGPSVLVEVADLYAN
jgi:pyruvate/2-oxoglutarate/acetoin dehydrogenase E1 component